MKKAFTIIIVCCIATIAFAQPRVDGDIPLKITKSSQIITNPIGWAYDDFKTKKWCGYYGVMYGEYRNNNKTPITLNVNSIPASFLESTENHSVLSMQIKETMIDSTICYLLYVQRYSVDYDYPAIERGRHNYKEFAIFVLPVNEYNKLWSLDSNVTTITSTGSVRYCTNASAGYRFKSERTALANLNNEEYLNPKNWGADYFYVKKENENTIRFYPPTSHSLIGESGYGPQIDMSKTYFEVSAATFNKLKIQ